MPFWMSLGLHCIGASLSKMVGINSCLCFTFDLSASHAFTMSLLFIEFTSDFLSYACMIKISIPASITIILFCSCGRLGAGAWNFWICCCFRLLKLLNEDLAGLWLRMLL